MPTNINCQCYRKGQCMHADAPRFWFRRTLCVLEFPPTDPRTLLGCALQYPHKRPDGFPLPPPMRVMPEGGQTLYSPPNTAGKPASEAR